MNIQELTKKAEEIGSYFLTLTIHEKDKEENNLQHYVIQEKFSRDDIIPSLDEAVRSMGVNPPIKPDVIIPDNFKEYKPLKVAIITHFSRCPSHYSPGNACKALILMLKEHGHSPVFFTQEGSKLTEEEIGCEVRPVVTRFKRQKNIVDEQAKLKFIDVLREQLTDDFDLAISMDLYIDDCVTYRESIKEAGVNIPYLHWARSGIGHPIDFKMLNSRYLYMNKADTGIFSKNIGVDIKKVRVINNVKDPLSFWRCDDITKMIIRKYRLWEKDIVQTLACCSTRISSKGVQDVIAVFGELKKLGNDVCLIFCNSNGRKRENELKNLQKLASSYGLNENDFIITSLLASDKYPIHSEVPNHIVGELLRFSNLFIFATRAEVAPQVLLEASLSKNLVVLNEDLPLLKEFCDKNSAIFYPFTSNQSLHYSGRDLTSLNKLAKIIHGQIHSNKAFSQFKYAWKAYNSESVYRSLMNIIMELLEDFKKGEI